MAVTRRVMVTRSQNEGKKSLLVVEVVNLESTVQTGRHYDDYDDAPENAARLPEDLPEQRLPRLLRLLGCLRLHFGNVRLDLGRPQLGRHVVNHPSPVVALVYHLDHRLLFLLERHLPDPDITLSYDLNGLRLLGVQVEIPNTLVNDFLYDLGVKVNGLYEIHRLLHLTHVLLVGLPVEVRQTGLHLRLLRRQVLLDILYQRVLHRLALLLEEPRYVVHGLRLVDLKDLDRLVLLQREVVDLDVTLRLYGYHHGLLNRHRGLYDVLCHQFLRLLDGHLEHVLYVDVLVKILLERARLFRSHLFK